MPLHGRIINDRTILKLFFARERILKNNIVHLQIQTRKCETTSSLLWGLAMSSQHHTRHHHSAMTEHQHTNTASNGCHSNTHVVPPPDQYH